MRENCAETCGKMFDDLSDLFKTIFPCYLLISLPLLIIISDPVSCAADLRIQRMSQYDFQGIALGEHRNSKFP